MHRHYRESISNVYSLVFRVQSIGQWCPAGLVIFYTDFCIMIYSSPDVQALSWYSFRPWLKTCLSIVHWPYESNKEFYYDSTETISQSTYHLYSYSECQSIVWRINIMRTLSVTNVLKTLTCCGDISGLRKQFTEFIVSINVSSNSIITGNISHNVS